ncbi:tigger transposable element-derived protein [Plakobranchus ocellatus]|uniref:Tigger transposable element-derived protein n=1 Tax=Plakobranchus ocellatus TaxID=259542 RepID=A0AAV4BTB5_9GAST|nr:tigger transposable element-derived protein [Plakobranchus ocellatus]
MNPSGAGPSRSNSKRPRENIFESSLGGGSDSEDDFEIPHVELESDSSDSDSGDNEDDRSRSRNETLEDENSWVEVTLFLDDEFWRLLCRETNNYADQFLNSEAVRQWLETHPSSRYKKWPADGVSISRLRKHIGLLINMGLTHKNVSNSYWTTRKSQATPYFGSIMGVDEFNRISRMIHLNNVEAEIPRELDVLREEGQAHAVVRTLMQESQLLNKGYRLFTDNFYTKPKTAEFLFANKTALVGTVRVNSVGMPKNVAKQKLQVGEGKFWRKYPSDMLAIKSVCGESEAVDDKTVDDWRRTVLADLLKKYSPTDIYNADETGLFWRLLPGKTMEFRGKSCHGVKQAKERITVLCCANMNGSEKWPLFVICKFKQPRCFKGIRKLPVTYETNKSAWMTSTLFTSWLQDFDRTKAVRERKVVLIVDNCSAHPPVKNLKATELVFLPPNVTAKLQPCDMGIINNLKVFYRGILLKRLIQHVDSNKSFESLKPTLLEAVSILKSAWSKVEPATVINCFRKAGFHQQNELSEVNDCDTEQVSWHRDRAFALQTLQREQH